MGQAQAGAKEGRAESRSCHRYGLLRMQATSAPDTSPLLLDYLITVCHWTLHSTTETMNSLSHLCITPSQLKIPRWRPEAAGYTPVIGTGLVLREEELGVSRHPQRVYCMLSIFY